MLSIILPSGYRGVFKVSRVVETGFSSIDDNTVFMDLDVVRRLLGFNDTMCTCIVVKTDSLDKALETTSTMNKYFRSRGWSVKARSWRELASDLLRLVEVDKKFMYLLVASIALLVGLGIVNVMILVVEGMKREIGVLKAIGLSSRKIFILFIIVSLFYSLIGYLLGVSIASVLVYMTGSICIEVGGQHYSITPVYTPVGYLYSFLYTILLTIISCSL